MLTTIRLLRFHLHRPPCIPSFYTTFTPSYFYSIYIYLGRDNRVWHSSCKTFCSVISFSVINYVVSMRCPRGSDDSSFFIYTPVYIKNELGLGESGLSNPSRQSRQPLLGACALHFVSVGDSIPPLHSVTASRRLLPPCLSTNSYEKNELGLFESVTFQP